MFEKPIKTCAVTLISDSFNMDEKMFQLPDSGHVGGKKKNKI